MNYFKLLNFEREPFSNSPDPGLFYNSKQHLEALQKLEISVRLKRGLNVILGDVGTGKTTLSRQLIQKISNDDAIKYYVMLDPGFNSNGAFLRYLLHLFQVEEQYGTEDEAVLKEIIKKHLFSYGVDKQINIVIIIDEGQKLSLSCIEVLRELLNFETNDQKLLQIVIFAQNEFEQSLNQVENFKDRINFYYQLKPLNFKESKGLINYRLETCFIRGHSRPLFSSFGYYIIYKATRGFPRKIITLCHQILLSLITQNRSKAGFFLIRSCALNVFPERKQKRPALLSGLLILVLFLFLYNSYMRQPDLNAGILASKTYTNKIIGNKILVADLDLAKPQKQIEEAIVKNTSVKQTDNILKKPEIYGSIGIPQKSTLNGMIYIVYGDYKQFYLDQILATNPDIRSPEKIKAGMLIKFPVLPEIEDLSDNDIFVVLSENRDINLAFLTAYKYRSQDLNVRILPVWNEERGFLFPVVINQSFTSMVAADNYKTRLPENIFAESKQILLIKNSEKKQKG